MAEWKKIIVSGSKAHLNQADRDLEYEKKIQLQPHIIYLALSSHLKVGVTRKTQIPTRWIDQGAHEAMTIIEVPNRYLAGIGEVALKEYFSDKEAEDDINDSNTDTKKEHIRRDVNITVEDIKIGADFNIED